VDYGVLGAGGKLRKVTGLIDFAPAP